MIFAQDESSTSQQKISTDQYAQLSKDIARQYELMEKAKSLHLKINEEEGNLVTFLGKNPIIVEIIKFVKTYGHVIKTGYNYWTMKGDLSQRAVQVIAGKSLVSHYLLPQGYSVLSDALDLIIHVGITMKRTASGLCSKCAPCRTVPTSILGGLISSYLLYYAFAINYIRWSYTAEEFIDQFTYNN